MNNTQNVALPESAIKIENQPLCNYVRKSIDDYFGQLGGHIPAELHAMVIREVEKPLFQAVLDHTKGNQCKAAEILGISRTTLRKKLKQYQLET